MLMISQLFTENNSLNTCNKIDNFPDIDWHAKLTFPHSLFVSILSQIVGVKVDTRSAKMEAKAKFLRYCFSFYTLILFAFASTFDRCKKVLNLGTPLSVYPQANRFSCSIKSQANTPFTQVNSIFWRGQYAKMSDWMYRNCEKKIG